MSEPSPITRDHGIYIGSRIIHLISCGPPESVAALGRELEALDAAGASEKRGMFAYLEPPFNCDCGKVRRN